MFVQITSAEDPGIEPDQIVALWQSQNVPAISIPGRELLPTKCHAVGVQFPSTPSNGEWSCFRARSTLMRRGASPSFPRITRRFTEKPMTGHDSRSRTPRRHEASRPGVDNGCGCTPSVAPARADARVRERERERDNGDRPEMRG